MHQLGTCDLQPLQLFLKILTAVGDVRILLGKLLADALAFQTIDAQPSVQRLQQVTLYSSNKLVIDRQGNVVGKTFVCDCIQGRSVSQHGGEGCKTDLGSMLGHRP
jgi:hypothetical protein